MLSAITATATAIYQNLTSKPRTTAPRRTVPQPLPPTRVEADTGPTRPPIRTPMRHPPSDLGTLQPGLSGAQHGTCLRYRARLEYPVWVDMEGVPGRDPGPDRLSVDDLNETHDVYAITHRVYI